jgi:hypothetical protein
MSHFFVVVFTERPLWTKKTNTIPVNAMANAHEIKRTRQTFWPVTPSVASSTLSTIERWSFIEFSRRSAIELSANAVRKNGYLRRKEVDEDAQWDCGARVVRLFNPWTCATGGAPAILSNSGNAKPGR